MVSLFKKTVLSVAMLGCAFGMQAEKKAVSTGAAALATGAMVAGAAGTVYGAMSFGAQMAASDLPPSVAGKFLATGPYALIAIPGILLMGGAAIYCFKSAKGVWPKMRATLGSALTIGGGLILALAGLTYMGISTHNANLNSVSWSGLKENAWYAAHNVQAPSQTDINQLLAGTGIAAIGGGVLSLLGYAMQPKDNSKEQA